MTLQRKENRIPVRTLAFDFDGVMADTMALFLDIARDRFGIDDISSSDMTDYDLSICLDVPGEILSSILEIIVQGDHAQPLRPMPGAVDTLSGIIRQTGVLRVVTARPDSGPVWGFLRENFGVLADACQVVSTGSFEGKLGVLLDMGVTHFIEDRVETCFMLEPSGIQPVLFAQPWNRRPHPFPEVTGWEEIRGLVGFE